MNWPLIITTVILVIVVCFLYIRKQTTETFPQNKKKKPTGRILITDPDDVRNLLDELYGAHFGGGSRNHYKVRVDALKWDVNDHAYARTLKNRLAANPQERVIVEFIYLRRTANDSL